MAEEIIFKTSVDTGTTAKDLQAIDKELGNIDKTTKSTSNDLNKTFDDLNKRVESGTMSMRESTQAIKQYQTIALQAGRESPIGKEALQRAGDLKDKLTDLKTEVNNLGTDGANMKAALQLGSTITAGYGALTGVQALLGKESENLTKTLVKLQAVQAILAALEEVRGALEKESFLMQKAKTLQTTLLTTATAAYATVVGTSTGALKMFRIALAATGIGALIVGIGVLIANFDKLKEAMSSTSERQKALNATLGDYKNGAQDAIAETNNVKVAFDLARTGVISKGEALKTYNDTLGATFGNAKDLNEAEKLFNEKTGAYVKAASLRAQANALFALAAEESAKALTSQMEDQRTAGDEIKTGLLQATGFVFAANDVAKNQQEERRKEAKKTAEENAKNFVKLGEELLKEVGALENANGLKSKSNQEYQAEVDAQRKANAEKAKTDREKAIEAEYAKNAEELEAYKRRLEEERGMQEAEDAWKLEQELSAEEAQRLKDEKTRADEEELSAWKIKNWEKEAAEEERIEKEKAENKKKIRDLNIQATTDSLTTLSNLAQLFAGKDKESQKRAFNIQKAVSVAQATIDTYKGATAALASGSAINPVYGFASAAAVVTAGLLNVRKILSQKFEGGGDTSTSSVQPPSTQVNEPNPQLANADTTITSTIGQGKANLGKVYVVDSEITAKQNQTAQALNIATVG